MKLKLVYFDDQAQNIEMYRLLLNDEFNVQGYTSTRDFDRVLQFHKPHGILLDYHMPELDGLSLYVKIVESNWYNGCPIFFISGDISKDTRLKTIQTGALDFFDRSINERELRLRLINKIRIFFQGASTINIGNLEIDSEKFTAHIDGKPTELTLIETRILFNIIKSLPNGVDKNELMLNVWGESTTKGKMSVHLSNMKIKLWDWDHEIKVKDNLITVAPVT